MLTSANQLLVNWQIHVKWSLSNPIRDSNQRSLDHYPNAKQLRYPSPLLAHCRQIHVYSAIFGKSTTIIYFEKWI
jgi:hypothetical protein